MNVLLLKYLKEVMNHPYMTFESEDLRHIELPDFMYWLGKQIKED
jgi:hypothetical protein